MRFHPASTLVSAAQEAAFGRLPWAMSDSSSMSVLWYALQRNEFLFPVLMSLVLIAVASKPLNWTTRLLKRSLGRLSGRLVLSCAAVALLVMGIRVALLPWIPVPAPWVHDEFSHLLLADTLIHGRVTNPPSPMWVHFETFHVNMLPTYQSMYLPAQGIVLAIGMFFFRSAYAGVVLSVGVMCAAYLWAFRGWMNRHWAMLGALVTVLTYCSADYWMNSYWGGAVAATGGALVLGVYGRIRKPCHSPRRPAKLRVFGVLLGLGLLLLANTRPYEGFVYAVPFGVGVLWWLYQSFREKQFPWRTFVAPLLLVLIVGFAAMMYYFWRSTGNPLKMPYAVNQEQYHPTSPFVWQKTREVHYNHPVMQKLYTEWELGLYANTRTLHGALANGWQRIISHGGHFLRWLFLPFLLGAIYAIRRPGWRVALSAPVLMLLGMAVVIWKGDHHYAAPAAPALLLICLLGFRWMSVQLRKRQRLGQRFARAYVVVYIVLLLTLQLSLIRSASVHPYTWAIHRVNVNREMNSMPGKHLILVRYWPGHDVAQEWVYNGYDLENGKVLWAREMADPAKNRELIDYYKGREVWLFEADRVRAKPVPYAPLR